MRFNIEIPASRDGTFSLGIYDGENQIGGLHLTHDELKDLDYAIQTARIKYRDAHLFKI